MQSICKADLIGLKYNKYYYINFYKKMKKIIKYTPIILFFLLAMPLSVLAYGSGSSSSSSGGGGGGGSSYYAPESTSNAATSAVSSMVSSAAVKDSTYSRPIDIGSNLIKTDTAAKTKTAELTSSTGSITLMPNSASTVSLTIPASTTLTSTTAWDGKIDPPLVQSNTKILSTGSPISGSTKTLTRTTVQLIVKAGSDVASLTFSKKVTLKVPVSGKITDTSKVSIFYSSDAKTWTYLSDTTAVNGYVTFDTDHLTYFAFETGGTTTATTTTTTTTTTTVQFADIDSHWAKTYIEGLKTKGIVSGKTAVKFAPDDTITRAELTKMAVVAFNYTVPSSAVSTFSDVAATAWYAPYVSVAKTNSIVSGYSATQFAPNASVTRAEALKILLEASRIAGVSDYSAKSSGFLDVVVSAWYNKYVGFAKAKSVVSGYSATKFAPDGKLTRAEAAKMVSNVMGLK